MPVTTAAQLQNVVSLHHSDEGVIALEPVIATGVDPADVMTAVSRSALVRHNSDQLVVSRVQARVEWPVQNLVVFLDLFFFLGSFGC